jgi:hypothetical protein
LRIDEVLHFEKSVIIFFTSVSFDLLKLDDRFEMNLGRGSNLAILLFTKILLKSTNEDYYFLMLVVNFRSGGDRLIVRHFLIVYPLFDTHLDFINFKQSIHCYFRSKKCDL